MLHGNSKELSEKVNKYIKDHFIDYYNEEMEYCKKNADCDTEFHNILSNCNINDFSSICDTIKKIYYLEYVKYNNQARYMNKQDLFIEYLQGLPSCINADYYYNVSAVDLLGGWLEQNEFEKSKHTEQKAEYRISSLIYRQLRKNRYK